MKIKKIEKQNQILVSGYQLLSTGVNIKKLHNLVLASPMKAHTTISQSIGRMMRLHPSKKIANVYDIVDNLSLRGIGGIFVKQYNRRKNISYITEEYPIKKIIFNLY